MGEGGREWEKGGGWGEKGGGWGEGGGGEKGEDGGGGRGDFGGDIDRKGKNLPQVSATSFLTPHFQQLWPHKDRYRYKIIVIYGPMIYMASYVMQGKSIKRANGMQMGGGWAHQKHCIQGRINQRFIGSFMYMSLCIPMGDFNQ